jgi:hypothetical protein
MASGYFSSPSDELDPALFDGVHLKDGVRTGLLNVLYSGLENEVGFQEPWNWVTAWVAGSGVSYQWDADRGNGDLDVLFGADFTRFLQDNPQFPRLTMAEVSEYTNQILKAKLWPKTSHYDMGGKAFEVTFFWNPTTGTSIESIHPYAAYDLVHDSWVVTPPELPQDPHSLYPQHWFEQGDRDAEAVKQLKAFHDTGGVTGRLTSQRSARFYWDKIHGGRKQAFSDIGSGYGDFHNFRWQHLKSTGAMETLRGLVQEADVEDPLSQRMSPADILTRDAIRYATGRYTG